MISATPAHMLTSKELRRIEMPTMLIWGRFERILPSSGLAFFRKHMKQKHVEFHDEEEFGHVPFIDDCDRLVKIMGDFFARAGLKDDASLTGEAPSAG